MPRAKVKMIKDHALNQKEKEGQDRIVYRKGAELSMSKEQADEFVELGIAKKLAFKAPDRTPIDLTKTKTKKAVEGS